MLVVLARTLREEERVCLWLRFQQERVWKRDVLMGASPLSMLPPGEGGPVPTSSPLAGCPVVPTGITGLARVWGSLPQFPCCR